MGDFLGVFAANILPIFVVAAMGYLLRARLGLEKRVLSTLTFYAFSPSLVFFSLVNSELETDELVDLAVFTIIVVLSMGLIGLVMARLLKLSRQDTIALLLVLMFVNGGNYGLTLNDLRYGSDGVARAAVFFVTSSMLVFTLGVFIASMGQANWRDSLKRLVRLPAFYAVVLALLIRAYNVSVPAPLMRGVEIAAAGAIPVMLVVLGMQIADLKTLERVWLALPASLARLIVGPVIAVLIASWLRLSGLTFATAVIEASMPTAVIATILATEFYVRPGLVTSTVVLSTLLSAVTLPVVISVLGL